MREMPGVHIDQNRCSHKSECAGRLTGEKILHYIKTEFGVEYHHNAIYKG